MFLVQKILFFFLSIITCWSYLLIAFVFIVTPSDFKNIKLTTGVIYSSCQTKF